jgi:hypothetical protein
MKQNRLFKTILPLCVSAIFSLVSCQKEDSAQAPGQPGTTVKIAEFSTGDSFIRFDYNTDGTVSKITLDEDPLSGRENISFTVKYDANKKPQELTGSTGTVIRTTYNNGRLVKAEMTAATIKIAKTDYTYEGSVLKKVEGYVYDDNDPIPFYQSNFTYGTSGNITKADLFAFDPFQLNLVPAGYVNLQYDNKPNPLAAVNDFLLMFWQTASGNNITREAHFDEQNRAQEVIERTYTYNSQGYPVKAVVRETLNGQQPVTSEEIFRYK